MQNKSHAVMAQRTESKESLDNFPTPPWATRALIEHVIGTEQVNSSVCLEPACGQGHMAKVLHEYFPKVDSYDIEYYGYGMVQNFICAPIKTGKYDWIITNPPFKLAEEFAVKAIGLANRGVALLTRTVFIESIGRYNRLFNETPPTYFAQFSERVPMVKGRLDPKASTATGYGWLIWDKHKKTDFTQLVWIPPCRKALERYYDYAESEREPLFFKKNKV